MTNDVRTKSIAFLNAVKSALAYNSKPGFKELMKTFGLPANPWIPGELEAIKVIEVIGEKSSNAKQWRWVSKDAAEQIFDALVLHRRGSGAPVVASGVSVLEVRKIVDELLVPDRENASHFTAMLMCLIRDIHGKESTLEQLMEFSDKKRVVVAEIDALRSLVSQRPPAAELLEMAINDLSSLSQRMSSLEGNVTAIMREVFKGFPAGAGGVPPAVSAPASGAEKTQSAKRKPLRIGVLGPWQRDWRYVLENVTYPDDVLVMIDRDVRPLRVVKGYDYVVIAADCSASASEFRQVYGERALMCPAGGMKRLASFVNELIERHDKAAKVAAA